VLHDEDELAHLLLARTVFDLAKVIPIIAEALKEVLLASVQCQVRQLDSRSCLLRQFKLGKVCI